MIPEFEAPTKNSELRTPMAHMNLKGMISIFLNVPIDFMVEKRD